MAGSFVANQLIFNLNIGDVPGAMTLNVNSLEKNRFSFKFTCFSCTLHFQKNARLTWYINLQLNHRNDDSWNRRENEIKRHIKVQVSIRSGFS